MSERAVRVATAALTLLGAAVAAYLLYARWTDSTLACSTGGCETVQSSRYAEILGVPVALLALAGFLTVLGASLVRGGVARLTGAIVAVAAVFFGVYLLYVQVAVLGAVCQWCLGTDAIAVAVAALTLLRLRAA